MEQRKGIQVILLNLAIGLGTFMQILDTSIANVAIPYIAGNLSVSADQGTWVITSFAASNAIVLPLTGWLSDYFGRVRLFVWSIALFSFVSFLCGLSNSLAMLVTLRVVQGAVAGSLIPLSQSLMIASNPPEKQGAALGFWTMIVVVAPIMGPIIGGYLTYEYSWPWIFYINVPLGIFSASIVWLFLKGADSEIVRNPIDWFGLFLLSTSVACLQIMLDKGKDLDWFESNAIIVLTLVSLVSLLYFVIWNRFQEYRIVDFSFFKNRNFLFGTLLTTMSFLLYFCGSVTLPLWLQTEQNYTPLWAGIAIAPVGVAPFFLSITIGKNMHRFDLRYLIALSFIFFAISFFYQANFTTQVDLQMIMFSRFIQGFGVAFFFLPLVQLSLGEIPKNKYASASGLFHFIRILVGSGFGTSLSVYLWSRREIFHHIHLSEALTHANQKVNDFYLYLYHYSSIFKEPIVTGILDQQAEQQAFMLSINDLSWLSGWLFIVMIPFIFLCKPVKVSVQEKPIAAH